MLADAPNLIWLFEDIVWITAGEIFVNSSERNAYSALSKPTRIVLVTEVTDIKNRTQLIFIIFS